MADLQISGISPLLRDVLHILARGGDRAELHFFSSIAGKLSGPGAAFEDNSFIASASSVSLKVMKLRLGELG